MNILNIQSQPIYQEPAKVREVRKEEAAGAKGLAKAPMRAVRDEYVPTDTPVDEAIGLYRLGRDGNGDPKIEFDDPERAAQPEKPEGAPAKASTTTTNTDAVDRELEQLRKKAEEKARERDAEQDPSRKAALQRECSRLEAELAQKDNDTYRRQHASVTQG